MVSKYVLTGAGIAVLALGFSSALAAAPPPVGCKVSGTCVYYVDENNPGEGTGSMSNPYKYLGQAVANINNGSTHGIIKVAGGTYIEGGYQFEALGRPVEIVGGYSEDFTVRNPDLYPTILRPGNQHALYFFDTPVSISGFVFENGTGGAAVVGVDNSDIENGDFSINDNVFRNNSGVEAVLWTAQNENAEGLVIDNELMNNDASLGSVLLLENVSAERNILSGNTGYGLATCDGGTAYNNFFVGNDTTFGIVIKDGCRFVHNSILHNDFDLNQSVIRTFGGGGNTFINNLLAFNSAEQLWDNDDGSKWSYNAHFDNTVVEEVELGSTNVECDPMLAGPSQTNIEDHHLGSGSDCLDAGQILAYVQEDYNLVSRPADGDGSGTASSDPGAYEEPDFSVDAVQVLNVSAIPVSFSPDGDESDDTTMVQYSLSEDATVTASIYDESGTTLVKRFSLNQAKNAGDRQEIWDGTNEIGETVSNGVYLFKVVASNEGGGDSKELLIIVDAYIEEEEEPIEEEPVEEEVNEEENGEETEEEPIGEEAEETGQCVGYSDVSASHPDCAAIEYVQSIGAMTGNPNGTFAPNAVLQRDQVAKISLETFGLFETGVDYCSQGDFVLADMGSEQWSHQYVCRGVQLGMITGYESGPNAGKFVPAQSVNRVEFLALILRNVDEVIPDLMSESYNDVEPGQWFSGYARYSQDLGLFIGANLLPEQVTTRAEVADVVYKLHNAGKISS